MRDKSRGTPVAFLAGGDGSDGREGGIDITILMLFGVPSLGHAQVRVNIGINLSAPPQLVPVPATPVMYAPSVGANYFFYGSEYYVFANGGWYVSPGHNGPWALVAPEFVPPPILMVPASTTGYPHRPGNTGGVTPLRAGSLTGDSGGRNVVRQSARSSVMSPEGRVARTAMESVARTGDRRRPSNGGAGCTGGLCSSCWCSRSRWRDASSSPNARAGEDSEEHEHRDGYRR